MNRRGIFCIAMLGVGLGLISSSFGFADDSAVSIAAGGLVPRREVRIVMAKEVLSISEKKVIVDYDFRNDTDQDVITEVAFPILPYKNEFLSWSSAEQSFQSFRLWVDGKPINYKSEVKATLKNKDVSAILEGNQIDIKTFGHFDDLSGSVPDFARLPKVAQSRMIKLGLFEDQGSLIYSLWTVHLQYHWNQTFPAHSTTHIKHEYSPAVGFTQITLGAVDAFQKRHDAGSHTNEYREGTKLLAGFCTDHSFLDSLGRGLRENEMLAKTPNDKLDAGIAYPKWVDFVLTSANTWQRPIEDFTLIVERPRSEQFGRVLISFCSPEDGNVEKRDPNHFMVHLTNFVPKSELHIGFFDLPSTKPPKTANKN